MSDAICLPYIIAGGSRVLNFAWLQSVSLNKLFSSNVFNILSQFDIIFTYLVMGPLPPKAFRFGRHKGLRGPVTNSVQKISGYAS